MEEVIECSCGWSSTGNKLMPEKGSVKCPECGAVLNLPDDISQYGGLLGENID